MGGSPGAVSAIPDVPLILAKAAAHHAGHEAAELERYLKTSGWGKSDDRLDAYLCAWIASLPETERRAYGSPPDDVIWVPRIG